MNEDSKDSGGWFPASGAKSEYLPIQTATYGFTQQTHYHHPDLYHEEVDDFDAYSIFTLPRNGALNDTKVYTYLLLGDQNAGKSTFLHAFIYEQDRHFTQLFSLLPLLSGSFVNTRFMPTNDVEKAMDEPPFIDTDLAKTCLLLSRDNFFFFLHERDIDAQRYYDELGDQSIDFACIQLIEIGGDHLDRLIAYEARKGNNDAEQKQVGEEEEDSVRAVLARSEAMLRSARKTIYFVNLNELVQTKDVSSENPWCEFRPEMLARLLARLQFLDDSFGDDAESPHHIMVKFTRLNGLSSSGLRLRLSSRDGVSDVDVQASEQFQWFESVIDALQFVVLEAQRRLAWQNIEFCDFSQVDHLDTAGHVDPEAVVGTLASLFHSHMVMGLVQSPELLAATYIIKSFADTSSRFLVDASQEDAFGENDEAAFSMWVTKETFCNYLADQHFVDIPKHTLLHHYDASARMLATQLLCLQHDGMNYASMELVFAVHDGDRTKFVCWQSRGEHCISSEEDRKHVAEDLPITVVSSHTVTSTTLLQPSPEVRFPFHKGFYDWIVAFLVQNVPSESWMSSLTATTPHFDYTSIAASTSPAQLEVFERLRAQLWSAVKEVFAAEVSKQPETGWPFLVWALEEYVQCCSLHANGRFDVENQDGKKKGGEDDASHCAKRQKTDVAVMESKKETVSQEEDCQRIVRLPIVVVPREYAIAVSPIVWNSVMTAKSLAYVERDALTANELFQQSTDDTMPHFRVVVPLVLVE